MSKALEKSFFNCKTDMVTEGYCHAKGPVEKLCKLQKKLFLQIQLHFASASFVKVRNDALEISVDKYVMTWPDKKNESNESDLTLPHQNRSQQLEFSFAQYKISPWAPVTLNLEKNSI